MTDPERDPQSRGPRIERRTTITATLDQERGVFMISVAAELAEMHPQTLRMYEAKGLINPKRSPKNTRLYSQADVEKLRRIQEMTSQQGLNLAGVETVLEMEGRVEQMRRELEQMRNRTVELEEQLARDVEKMRSLRTEIVPYGAYDVIPVEQPTPPLRPSGPVQIPVERTRSRRPGASA